MQDPPVVSVEAMRRADAYTIAHFVPALELMRRAAQGVYDAYPGWKGKKTAVIAGGGNNGGDGYALACILKRAGQDPVVYAVSSRLSEEGAHYRDEALSLGVPVLAFGPETDLSGYDVAVDCILGTGFSGPLRENAAQAVRAVNASGAYVVSVDINSGLDGDTGEAPLAVKSDLTVSIGFVKQGLLRGDAPRCVGKLVNADIGIVPPPEDAP